MSNKFVKAKYGDRLRRLLQKEATLETIVDFAGLPVFTGATVRTLVLVARRDKVPAGTLLYAPPPATSEFASIVSSTNTVAAYVEEHGFVIDASRWDDGQWHLEQSDSRELLDRINAGSTPLAKWLSVPICYGVKSGLVEAFVLDTQAGESLRRSSPQCATLVRPYLVGRDVQRYAPVPRRRDIIYTPHGVDMDGCDAVIEHLRPFRHKLEARATKQHWYELQQPQERYVTMMNGPKIVYPDIARQCRFTMDRDGHVCGDTTFAIPAEDGALLALLNSSLANFYFKTVCAALEGANDTYLRFKTQYVSNFPVPVKGLEANREDMSRMAEQMLALHVRLEAARSAHERLVLQRQVSTLDHQIDELIFDIYELPSTARQFIRKSVADASRMVIG